MGTWMRNRYLYNKISSQITNSSSVLSLIPYGISNIYRYQYQMHIRFHRFYSVHSYPTCWIEIKWNQFEWEWNNNSSKQSFTVGNTFTDRKCWDCCENKMTRNSSIPSVFGIFSGSSSLGCPTCLRGHCSWDPEAVLVTAVSPEAPNWCGSWEVTADSVIKRRL